MAYLTRRILLRHGTPQIRKAQIPRSPCGFTRRRERLEAGTMKKRVEQRGVKRVGGGERRGRRRESVGKLMDRERKRKGISTFRRSRSGGTI